MLLSIGFQHCVKVSCGTKMVGNLGPRVGMVGNLLCIWDPGNYQRLILLWLTAFYTNDEMEKIAPAAPYERMKYRNTFPHGKPVPGERPKRSVM